MINAQFYENREHKLLGFHISGHSDLAMMGEDVCCAAVSSAGMLTCNTITEVFKINAKVSDDGNDIMLKFISDDGGEGDKMLVGLMIQLGQIERQYPGNIKLSVETR